MSGVLVYERPGPGHRRRMVDVLCRLLDGTPLIAEPKEARATLETWPGPVFLGSANTYAWLLAPLVLARLRTGHRTVLHFVRDPRDYSPNCSHFLNADLSLNRTRLKLEIALRLPGVYTLSIMPPVPQRPRRVRRWIYDLEWWDLEVMPLGPKPVELPVAADEKSVVFIGTVVERKGLEFFMAASDAAKLRELKLRFLIIGDVSQVSPSQIAQFQESGGIVLPRMEDDGEFVSVIRQADWIWCCYQPGWEASSGIFGRAIQLGTKTIVRKGSYLEYFHSRYGRGMSVAYGDVSGLLDGLSSNKGVVLNNPDIDYFRTTSIRRLREILGTA